MFFLRLKKYIINKKMIDTNIIITNFYFDIALFLILKFSNDGIFYSLSYVTNWKYKILNKKTMKTPISLCLVVKSSFLSFFL